MKTMKCRESAIDMTGTIGRAATRGTTGSTGSTIAMAAATPPSAPQLNAARPNAARPSAARPNPQRLLTWHVPAGGVRLLSCERGSVLRVAHGSVVVHYRDPAVCQLDPQHRFSIPLALGQTHRIDAQAVVEIRHAGAAAPRVRDRAARTGSTGISDIGGIGDDFRGSAAIVQQIVPAPMLASLWRRLRRLLPMRPLIGDTCDTARDAVSDA